MQIKYGRKTRYTYSKNIMTSLDTSKTRTTEYMLNLNTGCFHCFSKHQCLNKKREFANGYKQFNYAKINTLT